MAKKLYEESNIAAIAEKIRSRTGGDKKYTVAEMADGVDEAAEAAAEEKEAITRGLIGRSIEEIVIPEGVNVIGNFAFCGCNLVKSVYIPDGVRSIGSQAFNGAGNVAGADGVGENGAVVIPDSVTAIGQNAFVWSGIRRFIISKNVDRIESNVFGGCSRCESYDFTRNESVPTMVNVNAFDQMTAYKKAKIYVPASLYNQWIKATNWAEYSDYIEYVGSYESEGLIIEDGKIKGRGTCTDSAIFVPYDVKEIAMNSFVEDKMLEALILPDKEIGVLIQDYSVYDSNLRIIKNFYSSTVMALPSCPLELVTFLPSAKYVHIEGLNINNDATYDFTRHKEVVSLDSWGDYREPSEGTRFLVPASLYDEWINATNWSLYRKYIFPVETE